MRHRHRAVIALMKGPLPFFYPVNNENPNPAAHGNVRYVDTCRCGAVRETLINGRHQEVGPWYVMNAKGRCYIVQEGEHRA